MPSKPVIGLNDMEAQRFPWGAIVWLMGQAIDQDAQQTFGLVYINPGDHNPRHYHPNCEEILYVLSGSCDHSLGDEMHHMRPGDSIRAPAGVLHHAVVTGWEPLRAVISYSSGDRQTIFVDQEDQGKK